MIQQPHNIKAESHLLGSLLLNSECFDAVNESAVNYDDFYEVGHKTIFKAIEDLINIGKTPDAITVYEQIVASGGVGDMDYLLTLTENAPIVSREAIAEYASIINEKSLYRKLIDICSIAARNSSNQAASFDTIVDSITSELILLSGAKKSNNVFQMKDLVDIELGKLSERIKNKKNILGITSGFSDLDRITSGFKEGDMVVLAGRPGTGKTSLALNMAVEIAKEGHYVGFFSMEMPSSQLIGRMIATECFINSKNLLTGNINEEELTRMWRNIENIRNLPIFIDDTSSVNMSDIRSKSKKIRNDYGKLDAIFIDYLQLMKSNAFKEDRVRQVEQISRDIKLFAKDMKIPIIALAQLSRKVEERTNKIPMLSDLRDSGAIEQDADLVMFVHREDIYSKDEEARGKSEIIVQKNRHGETGRVPLQFLAQYTRFLPIDRFADENYNYGE